MMDEPGEETWWKVAVYTVCTYKNPRGSQGKRRNNNTRIKCQGVLVDVIMR